MISRRKLVAQFGVLAAAPAWMASAGAAGAVGALNASTLVRWQTSLGPIDIQLYDTAAPLTVANFLRYVNSGVYVDSFFHRSIPGFVLQGGGFSWPTGAGGPQAVPANAAVVNEYSSTRSNLRGTVAMAKLGSDPNSATNQWFVNLANNAANLDNQNGGFTVFGRVTTGGMAVVDKIAALKVVNASGVYSALPVINYTSGLVSADNVVRASAVTVLASSTSTVAAPSASDRVFNLLEGLYPQYVPVAGAGTGTGLGYYYRYYPATNSYVGTQNGNVYYLVPAIDGQIHLLGSLADWLAQATNEGY